MFCVSLYAMRVMVPYRWLVTMIFFAVTAFLTDTHAQVRISDDIEMDKTIHDFGDIISGSGPVSCTYMVKNIGSKPIVIYNVATSCGCTDVKWTKEPIRPGESGKISVTYSNDEGPYPFDKSLTSYFSNIKKPVILKLRGNAIQKKVPLNELYPVRFGTLGLRENSLKCGNLEQGGQKSEQVMVANLSDRSIKVGFKDLSPHLSVNVSPNPIPAKSTAQMSFTVSASRDLWGKQWYEATPVIDGKAHLSKEGKPLRIWAFTKENFSRLTKEQKDRGANPMFESSTYSFGRIRKGEKVTATFSFSNKGKENLHIYKVDCDAAKWSATEISDTAPGKKGSFCVELDTSTLPSGEVLAIVTLTTNSPLRPMVNLFIAGYIE